MINNVSYFSKIFEIFKKYFLNFTERRENDFEYEIQSRKKLEHFKALFDCLKSIPV